MFYTNNFKIYEIYSLINEWYIELDSNITIFNTMV